MLKIIFKIFNVLTILMASVSLLLLIKEGFEFGLAAPLLRLSEYYESWIQFALGWAEPPILFALRVVTAKFEWDPTLYPHWKHFFVLLMIYFGADARDTLRYDRKLATFLSVFGIFIAAVVSVGSGLVPLQTGSGDIKWEMLAASFSLAGLSLHWMSVGAWYATFSRHAEFSWRHQFFRDMRARFGLMILLLGCLAIAMGLIDLNVPVVSPILGSGLALVLVFVLISAGYFIFWGANIAIHNADRSGQSWFYEFKRNPLAREGFSVITVFSATALFLIANAGLVLMGA